MGVEKLVKLGTRNLTVAAFDGAVVRVERRWVATSLPSRELLQTFVYIYSRQYAVCKALARHVGSLIEEQVPNPIDVEWSARDSREILYIRLKDGMQRRVTSMKVLRNDQAVDPETKLELEKIQTTPKNISEVLKLHSELTKYTFNKTGSFWSNIYFYDSGGVCIYYGGTMFEDLGSKHIYWRMIADQVLTLTPAYVVWAYEALAQGLSRSVAGNKVF